MSRILPVLLAGLMCWPAVAQPVSADAAWNALIGRYYDIELPVALAEVTLDGKMDASDRDYVCGKAAEAERLLGAFEEALAAARNSGSPEGDGKRAQTYFERGDKVGFYEGRIADLRKQACPMATS